MANSMNDDQSTMTPSPTGNCDRLPSLFACRMILLACTLLSLCVFIYRSGHLETFWRDEMYTVSMISEPVSKIIEYTASDVHPPLYYFLLKTWIGFLGIFGIDPGIIAAKWFNVLIWFGSFLVNWQLLRGWIGEKKTCLVLGMLALVPSWIEYLDEMRNYTLIMAMVLTGGISFCIAAAKHRHDRFSFTGKANLYWLIYFVTFATAWWSHLLIGLTLLWFGLAWLYLVVRDAFVKKQFPLTSFFITGALTQILLILCILPWLQVLSGQLEMIHTAGLIFMTAPNLYNLLSVFTVTLMTGRDSFWYAIDQPLLILTNLFLLITTLGFVFRRSLKGISSNHDGSLLLFGFLIFAGFVYTTWLLSLYEIVVLFHAPRYPNVMVPFFVATVLISVLGTESESNHLSTPSPFILLLPWAGIFLYANALSMYLLKPSIDNTSIDERLAIWIDEGTPVHVYPESAIPWFQDLYPEYELLPLSDLLQEGTETPESISVLYAGIEFDRDDWIAWYVINSLQFHRDGVDLWHSGLKNFGVARFVSTRPGDLEALIPDELPVLENPWPVYPDNAVRILHAWNLEEDADGWSRVEADGQRNIYRWGIADEMKIQVDPPLLPGKYTFVIYGFVPPRFTEATELTVTAGNGSVPHPLPNGGFGVRSDFEVPPGETLSEITIGHPSSSPDPDHWREVDPRPLSILYNGAWIELQQSAP